MGEIFQIPITATDASFKIRTSLEGTDYVLRFDWNGRDECWQMGIMDSTETPIVMGIPLNINSNLIGRFEIPELPPGLLMLYDTSDNNEEAGRDDLGDRAVLLYEASE